jgi:2-haloacid dehalogenase
MPSAPRAIAFDVNGTMLDLHSLASLVRGVFGGRYSVEEWYHQMIEYSMATTLAGDYRDFADIALSVLMMAAAARGITVDERRQQKIREAMGQCPAFPDVKRSLRRLRDAGFTLIALSNSGSASLEKQLQNAGIAPLFHHRVSVELVRRFKPSPEPYQHAAGTAHVKIAELLMVAAHPWDLHGAARAGCQTAFIRRPGKAWFPGAPQPNYVATDFAGLADQMAGKSSLIPAIAGGAIAFGIAALIFARSRSDNAEVVETRAQASGARRY